jgi:hypothetical protein
MSSAPRRAALVCASLAALACAPLAALDAVQDSTYTSSLQLRLTGGSPTTYQVDERVDGQRWNWQGEEHTPGGVGIELTRAAIHPYGGFLIGGGINLNRHDITPTGYDYQGIVYKNTSESRLHATTLGISILAGWQYGLTGDWSRGIQFWGELTPRLGGGTAWASTDTVTVPGGGYSRSRGRGYYYEYGARLGVFAAERQIIGGLTVEYTRSKARVQIDIDGGRTSHLNLVGDGFAFGGLLGYAF